MIPIEFLENFNQSTLSIDHVPSLSNKPDCSKFNISQVC